MFLQVPGSKPLQGCRRKERVSTELKARRGGVGGGRRVFTAALPLALPAPETSALDEICSSALGTSTLCFRCLMNSISQDSASEVHIHQRCYVTITTTTTWQALETRGHKNNNICVADVALISQDSWPCEVVIFKQTVTSRSSKNESMHVLCISIRGWRWLSNTEGLRSKMSDLSLFWSIHCSIPSTQFILQLLLSSYGATVNACPMISSGAVNPISQINTIHSLSGISLSMAGCCTSHSVLGGNQKKKLTS